VKCTVADAPKAPYHDGKNEAYVKFTNQKWKHEFFAFFHPKDSSKMIVTEDCFP
jgi:hypothetical protein